MSWGIYLKDDQGNTARVSPHEEGAVIVVGGTDEAYLNVTYNYSARFKEAGITNFKNTLQGKKAKDVVALLRSASAKLGARAFGTQVDEDYWKPTAGNARHALSILIQWCDQHPDATFEVH